MKSFICHCKEGKDPAPGFVIPPGLTGEEVMQLKSEFLELLGKYAPRHEK